MSGEAREFCPVKGGCKEIANHHDTLYDKEEGLVYKVREKISRNDVLKAFGASLFLIIILFGLFANMWANSKDVPFLIEDGKQRERRITIAEERIKTLERDQGYILKNTEEIKKMLLDKR